MKAGFRPIQAGPVPAKALGRGLAPLLFLLLGGCSGSRFGEALSRSFPLPGTAPSAAPSPPATSSAPGSPAPSAAPTSAVRRNPAATAPSARPALNGGKSPGVRPGSGIPAGGPGPGGAIASPPAAPTTPRPATPVAQPAPYRVTIRLPQADPSAPAEVVTEALRAAGVPFEVETIERIAGAGGTAAPATVPAPLVRPAPTPR